LWDASSWCLRIADGHAHPVAAPAISYACTSPVRCVLTAPTSVTSSFCRPATPRSPGAPARPADCPPSWCVGACDAVAMSGKAFWRNRLQSNAPHANVSPTPVCALAEPISGCSFAPSSPLRSVSSFRVVHLSAPRRSHFIRRRAAAAGRAALRPSRPALDADAVRLAVVASVRHVDTDYDDLLMSGLDRETARVRVQQRVEDVIDAWRHGVTMLDG